MEETVEIDGERFTIHEILSRNKNATARLRQNKIIISLPSRWPVSERQRIGANLKKRAIRSIKMGKWNPNIGQHLQFEHCQSLVVMGKEFEINLIKANRFGVRVNGRKLIVAGELDKKHKITKLIRKKVTEMIMPELVVRVNSINEKYFKSDLSGIRIRDSVSRWGSCSTRDAITLNFRLLLMPPEILDYVIVHELAHTKVRGHCSRFWSLVAEVMPDHKEKRKWLRKNGWSMNLTKADPLEEPY